jgi:probable phosphoglycerate mutase
VRPALWLVRHGETEWSRAGRHTSRTDVPLTDAGRDDARALAPVLTAHTFAFVLRSPRTRAGDTAALAGVSDTIVDENLVEWDYGALEGMTSEQIRAQGPSWAHWSVWDGEIPGGETLADVAVRATAVLARVDGADGDVLCVGHGHMMRVLAAVALGLPPEAGRVLALDPATVSVLGYEHEWRVLWRWNARAV